MSRENFTVLLLSVINGFITYAFLSSPLLKEPTNLSFKILGGVCFFVLSLIMVLIIRFLYWMKP